MRGKSLAAAAATLLAWTGGAHAQTPSPMAYWQNAAGEVLAPLGGPIPEWRVTLGAGVATLPRYEGDDRYQLEPAPVVDIRWRDIAFLSTGDGLGINLIRGQTYRAGIAVGYDVGRDAHSSGRLYGLSNVDPAPEPRLFAEAAFLPFILTADVRRAIGGHNGVIGNVGAYMPVVGREDLVVFVGPSLAIANQRYMQQYFGITTAEAISSTAHLPAYAAGGGVKNVSFGTSAIYHFNDHLFIDGDIAWERLIGSAANSPIVVDKNQIGASITMGYTF